MTDLAPVNAATTGTIALPDGYTQAELVLPLDGGTFAVLQAEDGKVKFQLPENCFYFLVVMKK